MLIKILTATGIVLAVLALYINSRPAQFHVERSAVINAPANVVFTHINNLANWQAWSPWAKLDPTATTTFEGPSAGTGATMHWSGNSQVGAGTLTITDSQPDASVVMRLDFVKPMQGTSTATFVLTPEATGTRVTWSMDGTNNFIAKAISLVMDCDKMVGGQFEQGLANLKAVAEQPAPAPVS